MKILFAVCAVSLGLIGSVLSMEAGLARGGPSARTPATCVAVDAVGNLLIGDGGGIRKMSPDGRVSSVSGPFSRILGLAVDATGNIYVSDSNRILRISPAGEATTVAGGSSPGFGGDGGPAIAAQLGLPYGLAVDKNGNLFIADTGNHRVRKVTPAGIISTVAGTGVQGYNGDGRPAAAEQLGSPRGVAVDPITGELFIAEASNNRVRKVSADGRITTVAGTGGQGSWGQSFVGDGGPATAAPLFGPMSLAFDKEGNLFIGDGLHHRVRKMNRQGIISTVAGSATTGAMGRGARSFGGDGGSALAAQMGAPWGVAVDGAGSIYVADWENGRVRKVTPAGTINSIG